MIWTRFSLLEKKHKRLVEELKTAPSAICRSPEFFDLLSKWCVFPGTSLLFFGCFFFVSFNLLMGHQSTLNFLSGLAFLLLTFVFFRPTGSSNRNPSLVLQLIWGLIYKQWNSHEENEQKDIENWPSFTKAMEVEVIRQAFLNWLKQGTIGQREIQLAQKHYVTYNKIIKQCSALDHRHLPTKKRAYLDALLQSDRENRRNYSDYLPHVLLEQLRVEAQSQQVQKQLSAQTSSVACTLHLRRL